jgi:hypothetical protein
MTGMDSVLAAQRVAAGLRHGVRPAGRNAYSRVLRALCCGAAVSMLLAAAGASGQEKVPPPGGTRPPAAKAASPASPADEPADAIDRIFACVAQGLPEGWRRAWVTVTELSTKGDERVLEGHFQVSLEPRGDQRWDFVPCNARAVAEDVYHLNAYLSPEKRHWKIATLLFTNDGKYELRYEYAK